MLFWFLLIYISTILRLLNKSGSMYTVYRQNKGITLLPHNRSYLVKLTPEKTCIEWDLHDKVWINSWMAGHWYEWIFIGLMYIKFRTNQAYYETTLSPSSQKYTSQRLICNWTCHNAREIIIVINYLWNNYIGKWRLFTAFKHKYSQLYFSIK